MSEYIISIDDIRQLVSSAAATLNAWFMRSEHEEFTFPMLPEIVRCRDCKHFTPQGTHKFENGKVNVDSCEYVRGWMLQITPDGFCAWGERRES